MAEPSREDLAQEIEVLRRERAEGIDKRLGSLEGGLGELRKDIQKRFDDQTSLTTTTKAEGRRLILQVFSAVLVATIGAAGLIIVALINTSPG